MAITVTMIKYIKGKLEITPKYTTKKYLNFDADM